MSLYGVMRTSVSGMNAQSNLLSTVSDNISNSNTTGYKRASTEFSSLILKSTSGDYNSGGVETHVRYAITDQGSLSFTTSKTDLAIQNNGFFVVQDQGGANYLTRAGSFVPDQQGNLVNAGGFYLMGYPPGTTPPANSFTGLQMVNVNKMSLQATPSTTATVNANLDSNAAVLPGVAGPNNYTSKTSIVAYDDLGNAVTLDVYLVNNGPTAGPPPPVTDNWNIQVFNNADYSAGPPPSYTQPALSGGTLAFDPTTGALATGSPLNFNIPGGSAFSLDLSKMTQVASGFQFTANVDGNAPANVTGVEIDTNGDVYSVLSNGTKMLAYQIPLANVASPDNLTPEMNNVYSVGLQSGNVQIGYAGQNGLGTIQSGALEQSNVDLASELTSMIESQRAFTADSKVFQTGADLLDVVVNLKR